MNNLYFITEIHLQIRKSTFYVKIQDMSELVWESIEHFCHVSILLYITQHIL